MQPNDAPKLYQLLLNYGLEKWYPSDEPDENGLAGCIVFKTFQNTFEVLTKGSSIEGVHFQHQWYSNWSWIAAQNENAIFFKEIDEHLNDDCIREVVKYIDVLHSIHFARINVRFHAIVKEQLARIHIFPSTVGLIGLINFRYLLEMFKDSTKEIFLSLNVFPSTHGFYFEYIKKCILQIIFTCSGSKLKNVHLYDFNLTESEIENFNILKLFSERDIEIEFN